MGSSSSKSNINITNTVITQNSVDLMNEQVNKAVAETIIKAASKCSASSTQMASSSSGDIVASGPGSVIDWTTNIEQITSLTLSCLQQSIQDNTVGQSMGVEIFNQISQRTNSEQLNKMTGVAEASLKQGVGGSLTNPFSNVDTSVNQNLSNTQLTQTQLKLANIINNEVKNTVDISSIKNCAASNLQQATDKKGNIIATEGGVIKGGTNVKQISNTLAECKQLTEQVSQVTQGILAKMGVSVEQTTKNKQESEATASAKSTMEQKGLDDLVSALGSLIGNLFGLAFAPLIMGAVCICCIIICCIISCSLSVMAGAAGGDEEE